MRLFQLRGIELDTLFLERKKFLSTKLQLQLELKLQHLQSQLKTISINKGICFFHFTGLSL